MKEKDKILILDSILKVTILMIAVSLLLKMMGLNLFNYELDNKVLHFLCASIEKYKLNNILIAIVLFTQYFIFFKLSCDNKSSKIYYLTTIVIVALDEFVQIFIFNDIGYTLYIPYCITLLLAGTMFIDKKLKIKKPLLIILAILIYQCITLFLRNITFNFKFPILYEFLLNFDFIILLIITYYLHLMKGSEYTWHKNGVSLFLDLKTLSEKLQRKSHVSSNKSLSRQEKAERIIYTILSILWEGFSLSILVLVAFLNGTVIECLYILTSFVITKKVFGTPFHFNSAIKCFVVSNLTYYALDRITVSIGISFIIPVTLGILLAYFTSKLVKKNNTELYKGMSNEDLLQICQNKDLTKYELNILSDFYCNKMTLVAIGLKYNYSKDAIVIHKRKALLKLKKQN